MKPVNTEIAEKILAGRSFLLMAHKKPDGDAIGSVVALGRGLQVVGKEVDYWIDLPVEYKLNFFTEIKKFNQPLKDKYDALIFVDCSTYDFAFKPDVLPEHDQIIVIDHHTTNEGFGDINHVENTAAAAELVFRLLKQIDAPFDEEMIDAVYTGISTDTGSFQFSNVTPETHEILSILHGMKQNFAPLSKRLHHEKTFDQIKMYGAAIESLTLYADGQLAWTLLDHDTVEKYGGSINITDDISNIGVNVIGTIIGATIKEPEVGNYRISLRSRSPYDIDVSEIAKKHGGGGHQRASGFSFKGDLQDLRQELIDFLNAHQVEIDACEDK